MAHANYLIVGGGMAADAAVRGIREVDDEGTIVLLTEEADPPYDRPPLSKGLWSGTDEDRIWRKTEDLGRIRLRTGTRVLLLDRFNRTVTTEGGSTVTYDKLLLATGGRPRELADAVPQVLYFRTVEDYRRLRGLTETGERFVVVGGSFIGSEIAASLAAIGKKVYLLFLEDGLCRKILPPSLSSWLTGYFAEKGVEVRPDTGVASIRRHGPMLLVSVDASRPETIRVDGVVAGLGIEPNDGLAEGSGLQVDEELGGIVTDENFRTADESIWAAGDVAAFWSPVFEKQMRVEHEDHANTSGYRAGRAMAGEPEGYDYIPFFYSDLFDIGYEAVGELDPDGSEVVQDWTEENREGVLYYVRDGRVRGVLLWGVHGKLEEARTLIRDAEVDDPESLEGSISTG